MGILPGGRGAAQQRRTTLAYASGMPCEGSLPAARRHIRSGARYSTALRNSRVRSCSGSLKIFSGGPASITRPESNISTSSEMSRAKLISWVTQSIVMSVV